MKKATKILVSVLVILPIGCSEGPIFSELPESLSDKQFAVLNSNLQQVKIVQEKILSDLDEGEYFASLSFNPNRGRDQRGNAGYQIYSADRSEFINWSSNIVEEYTFEVSYVINGERETLDTPGKAIVATPYGLDYDYGNRIPFYMACFEYPDHPIITMYVSCTMIFRKNIFFEFFQDESFNENITSRSFTFSDASLSHFIFDSEENAYIPTRDALGKGSIIKFRN